MKTKVRQQWPFTKKVVKPKPKKIRQPYIPLVVRRIMRDEW